VGLPQEKNTKLAEIEKQIKIRQKLGILYTVNVSVVSDAMDLTKSRSNDFFIFFYSPYVANFYILNVKTNENI